jgi:hypothetical protein
MITSIAGHKIEAARNLHLQEADNYMINSVFILGNGSVVRCRDAPESTPVPEGPLAIL